MIRPLRIRWFPPICIDKIGDIKSRKYYRRRLQTGLYFFLTRWTVWGNGFTCEIGHKDGKFGSRSKTGGVPIQYIFLTGEFISVLVPFLVFELQPIVNIYRDIAEWDLARYLRSFFVTVLLWNCNVTNYKHWNFFWNHPALYFIQSKNILTGRETAIPRRRCFDFKSLLVKHK